MSIIDDERGLALVTSIAKSFARIAAAFEKMAEDNAKPMEVTVHIPELANRSFSATSKEGSNG